MWLLFAQGPEIDPTDLGHQANHAAALWAWGIFAVLLIVLWKTAWGPIAKGLAGRADRIAESLKKAEEIEKATRELAETQKATLAKAQAEGQALVAEARNAAKAMSDELLHKANAEIEAQRDRFTRETAQMIEKARAEMRKDAVELTMAATAKLIGRSLSDADSRRLATEALSDAERVARN
jgi:F-type H+-transporting ATPase subunit b